MKMLKHKVSRYGRRHRNRDGLTFTPVSGLRMMVVDAPGKSMHSVYRPLICCVLQGAKHMVVGNEERVFHGGQTVIVGADMPVVGRIVEASVDLPYLAVAVELQMTLLRDIVMDVQAHKDVDTSFGVDTLFSEPTENEVLDCLLRLINLLDRPSAAPILQPSIMRELHYWLLAGQHGSALRDLSDPASYSGRLAAAVLMLRENYRSRLSVDELAEAATMGVTAFHKNFKKMTSLTPGQFQKDCVWWKLVA